MDSVSVFRGDAGGWSGDRGRKQNVIVATAPRRTVTFAANGREYDSRCAGGRREVRRGMNTAVKVRSRGFGCSDLTGVRRRRASRTPQRRGGLSAAVSSSPLLRNATAEYREAGRIGRR